MNKRGTQVLQKLRFIRGRSNDSLYATRIPHISYRPQFIDVSRESTLVSTAVSSALVSAELEPEISPLEIFPRVQSFPGMSLGFELEGVLSDTSAMMGLTGMFQPPRISPVLAEKWAWESDESERTERNEMERLLAVLGPGKNPFNVGNDQKSVEIETFHNRIGHFSDPFLRETAR